MSYVVVAQRVNEGLCKCSSLGSTELGIEKGLQLENIVILEYTITMMELI